MSGSGQDGSGAPPDAPEAPAAPTALAAEPYVPSEEPTMPNVSGLGLTPSAGEISFRFYGHTDVGLVREHNEDNFLVADLSTPERGNVPGEVRAGTLGPRGLVLAVCDGMGGAAAGEVASQMAVDTVYDQLLSDDVPTDRDAYARRLVHAIEEAGSRIFSAAKMDRSRRGMGTTSTVAGLVDKVLFVGQVGDSRCYVLRNGQLSLISKDQSLVNQLIEAGQLTEEEAEAFEHSNIILQALGTTEKVVVDLTFLELRRGDRLMLCSDGLSGLVHGEMIRDVLSTTPDIREACTRLVEMANNGGGHDNITCIVADFDGEGLLPPDDAPPATYQQYPLPPDGDDDDLDAPQRDLHMKSGATKPGADVKRGSRTMEHVAPAPTVPMSTFPWWVLVVLGVSLVVLGLVAWMVSESPSEDATARPSAATGQAETPVEVRVRTDAPNCELFVDGVSYGDVSAGQDVFLELTPGVYRFEARVGDDVVATAVVTLRPNAPADVLLALPHGAADSQPEVANSAPPAPTPPPAPAPPPTTHAAPPPRAPPRDAPPPAPHAPAPETAPAPAPTPEPAP